jgi:hypothetical protein
MTGLSGCQMGGGFTRDNSLGQTTKNVCNCKPTQTLIAPPPPYIAEKLGGA